MKKTKVLYEIKTLEKLIARYFFNTNDCFKDFNRCHTTPTQLQIMEYIINHSKEDVCQKDLEKVLNLRRATVSGVLHTMEKNNMIKRIPFTEDARAKKIILNENAKKMFLEGKNKAIKLENIITQNISSEDLNTFCSVLNVMKDNIINM